MEIVEMNRKLKRIAINAEARLEMLNSVPEWGTMERDIWNLKFVFHGIEPDSMYWREGMRGSLQRAIKALEKEATE
jgi:hypothetical protein